MVDRSSLRLAFAAALQHLSARQRGALILRDVLSFSASEAAEILGTTVVSVNSSLQRARTRVKEIGIRQERLSEPSAAEQRAWVDRYMEAFEQADVEGLKRLWRSTVIPVGANSPDVISAIGAGFAANAGYASTTLAFGPPA